MVVGLFVGFTIAIALFIFREDDRDPIRYDNYEKIRIGMNATEVHEILGPKCGYSDGEIFTSLFAGKSTDPNLEWEGRNNRITVKFLDGLVERKSIENTSIRNFISSVKCRLGLVERQATFVTVGE